MGDFQQVVKYLDLNRASKDTTQNVKPLSLVKSRRIQKLSKYFTIPAFNVSNSGYATLVLQYNYTAPQDFCIVDLQGYDPVVLVYAMCIRYRVDNTVFRYNLKPTRNTVSLDLYNNMLKGAVQAPDYNGEVIKRNFCIEFWSAAGPARTAALEDYTIVTNLLRNPETPDESGNVLAMDMAQLVPRETIVVGFNEFLPTHYNASGQWLNN